MLKNYNMIIKRLRIQ